VSPDRRYQLQNVEANQQIDALLEHLRVPAETWRLESELVTTALKLFEDGAAIADLKIANYALKRAPLRLQGLRALPRCSKGHGLWLGAHAGGPHHRRAGPELRQADDRVRVDGHHGGGKRRHGRRAGGRGGASGRLA